MTSLVVNIHVWNWEVHRPIRHFLQIGPYNQFIPTFLINVYTDDVGCLNLLYTNVRWGSVDDLYEPSSNLGATILMNNDVEFIKLIICEARCVECYASCASYGIVQGSTGETSIYVINW